MSQLQNIISGRSPVALDPVIVKVTFEIAGVKKTYESNPKATTPQIFNYGNVKDIWIRARGTKYASPIKNECQVEIANLNDNTRNFLCSQFSPFSESTAKKIFYIEAGTPTQGVSLIYKGEFQMLSFSQPPDVVCSFKTLTKSDANLQIANISSPPSQQLSEICGQAAKNLNLNLRFETNNIPVPNYNYNGGALDEVEHIGKLANINAFVDDDNLVIKNKLAPVKGVKRVLSEKTGMIGQIERTEHGVLVKFFIDATTRVGGELEIKSSLFKEFNGSYIIYKLYFNISSRGDDFSYTAECIPYKKN